MNDTRMFDVGHCIQGQYRVVGLLGQGISGAVYLVADERTPYRQFVLKEVMHIAHEERRGLPFDVAVLKKLKHPALPHIYRVFNDENQNRYYILMDYVEGSNLEVVRRLMPGSRFSLHTAITLMTPIMDAVSYLHRQHRPLIHGDIKPSNIIAPIAGTSNASKLVDFGGIRDLSADGVVLQGALNFRAPEQYEKKASRRSDVYAIGAVFYTLLTGVAPVAASDRLAYVNAGKPDPLLPMSQFTPFAQTIAHPIHRALSLSRHDRFASVEQFREALWQVIYANPNAAWLSEPAFVVLGGEQTEQDPNTLGTESLELMRAGLVEGQEQLNGTPDDATLILPHATSNTNSSVQEAMDVPWESSLPSSGAVEGFPPDWVSPQGGPRALRRKKRRTTFKSSVSGNHTESRRKIKKTSLLVRALLLVCLIGSILTAAGYQTYNTTYQNEAALAQTGIKHLQSAASFMQEWSKQPLDPYPITSARHEFVAASTAFTQLNTDVQSFSRVGTAVPSLRRRLDVALRIASIATKISLAGVTGCDALSLLVSRFHNPLHPGNGLETADITALAWDLQQIKANVNEATAQINALQPEDLQLDSRISKAIAMFHRYLPSLQAFLHETDQLLPILPSLLGVGAPSFYLIEILDPAEMKPAGGTIKDYGFATFIGGRLSAAHVTDVNLLDTDGPTASQYVVIPSAYSWFDTGPQGWSLRDSNLDADFPTAANYAEQNFRSDGGRVTLQGVIAITPTLLKQALAIAGPIDIPELHETISAQNLIDRLHYYQQGPAGVSGSLLLSPKGSPAASRHFTELLGQLVLTRIQRLPSSAVPKLLQLLTDSLHTKDLQIYFNAAPAESLLQLSHADASIPSSSEDNLFVVDTNLAGDTANQFITNTLNDQVSIDSNGNATHHTTMRYAWVKSGNVYGSPFYSDYTRVYVPPGSSLQDMQGWQPHGTSKAFNREVWAGSFTLSYGETRLITLTWTEKNRAKKDATGWHYQYLIQRQAGASWVFNVEIALPSCAARTHISGGLVSHGHTALFAQSLIADTNLGIDYSCAGAR